MRISLGRCRPVPFALAACLALLTHSAGAQWGRVPSSAPQLEFADDPKDWISYFQAGATLLHVSPKRALQFFYWSSRLDPTHAEPYIGGWFAVYLQRQAETPQGDSLLRYAAWRDPFVHPVRVLQVIADSSERPSPDDRAWGALSAARYTDAAGLFAAALRAAEADAASRHRPPDDSLLANLHWGRVLSFHYAAAHDSAVGELEALRAAFQRSDTVHLQPVYRSGEWLDYLVGLSWTAAGHDSAAAEAFHGALSEQLSFYPARGALGNLALARGDTVAALDEWRQAAELHGGAQPGKSQRLFFAWQYGGLLLRLGKAGDALPWLRTLVELAPAYAEGHLLLGDALAAGGDAVGAAAEYQLFLRAAPDRLTEAKARVQRALAAVR